MNQVIISEAEYKQLKRKANLAKAVEDEKDKEFLINLSGVLLTYLQRTTGSKESLEFLYKYCEKKGYRIQVASNVQTGIEATQLLYMRMK